MASKGRLIEAKFVADLRGEVDRLTKQVTRMETNARRLRARIAALKQEIAQREPANGDGA